MGLCITKSERDWGFQSDQVMSISILQWPGSRETRGQKRLHPATG